jgi:hypothetical protein
LKLEDFLALAPDLNPHPLDFSPDQGMIRHRSPPSDAGLPEIRLADRHQIAQGPSFADHLDQFRPHGHEPGRDVATILIVSDLPMHGALGFQHFSSQYTDFLTNFVDSVVHGETPCGWRSNRTNIEQNCKSQIKSPI